MIEPIRIYSPEEIKDLSETYLETKIPLWVWKRELLWDQLIKSKGCEHKHD